ncbi:MULTISPECIES: DNA methyltransferase [Treponema]|uniref:Adenine-specific DNA modification methyltransferase n=1 Tax=Treponema denticola (strain ATCC 35405 / DSM 14222 / CIP 103919 / JCM 8153 / KCTC 15104) TaxID=243275 RepID=Q73R64_TREDE|nr:MULTISPECIES: DNA methyltransferase [Treponema]AAS10724.1 adenine-specific DNA modification methyltransferase [Treponema denticola ATCC 35405]EMB36419.1 hypothetical protein HMPREF9721_01645 [Treponema denticola ATCC 35404]EMB40631.1 hypothetical protein HMPREF9735_00189 [Treponema denticola ATCC 33521]HCY95704.1 hypothetical protein [Treponema sp.]
MKQQFKSIYFPSYYQNKQGKSITISFSNKEKDLFLLFSNKTNNEIRTLINVLYLENLIDYAKAENRNLSQYIKYHISEKLNKCIYGDMTFRTSKDIPFQRWYNYSEGYSIDFVNSILEKYFSDSKILYEPFAGTGTTIFACNNFNKDCYYSEVNPIMAYQIQAKLEFFRLSPKNKEMLLEDVEIFKNNFQHLILLQEDAELKKNYYRVFEKSIYFTDISFSFILKVKSIIKKIEDENPLLAKVLTITMISCLMHISLLKKSGDVRFKTKKELEKEDIHPIEVFNNHFRIIVEDIISYNESFKINATQILFNSKKIEYMKNIQFDGIITSPPYLNGTNYIRNTKLELWFMEFLKTKDDLRFFRDEIITSGINDVILSNRNKNLKGISKLLDKTINNLKSNSYDNRIPVMAEHYFYDMYKTFLSIREYLKPNGKIAIDIGDSIFGGVHIPTDLILIEILLTLEYKLIDSVKLRERRSRSGETIKQILLIFTNNSKQDIKKKEDVYVPKWEEKWSFFKNNIPYQKIPYSKKNWGNKLHSLCSYQGKLKPSIAHFLVNTFVPENGSILDPFSGVGTIPFEARLNNKYSFSFDISLPAYYISAAKLGKIDKNTLKNKIINLDNYIKNNSLNSIELEKYNDFGFNGKIPLFYEPNTYKEIILARKYFQENLPNDTHDFFIISAILHILHGNRPYALSRRSHPIVPYSPTGEFVYKNLIEHLTNKIDKDIEDYPKNDFLGHAYLQDSTKFWPTNINNLDAIITSPPFFDSTRFYLANWIRLWFCGWEVNDFQTKPHSFIDERQKFSFSVYESFFMQSRERLSKHGVLVLHLGKSKKCDMAECLIKTANKWFSKYDLFTEDVSHCQNFGIKDIGTVDKHQFLILR